MKNETINFMPEDIDELKLIHVLFFTIAFSTKMLDNYE